MVNCFGFMGICYYYFISLIGCGRLLLVLVFIGIVYYFCLLNGGRWRCIIESEISLVIYGIKMFIYCCKYLVRKLFNVSLLYLCILFL